MGRGEVPRAVADLCLEVARDRNGPKVARNGVLEKAGVAGWREAVF